MNITELIALASIRSGKTRGALSKEMGFAEQSKLSRIANGIKPPTASEIVYLAEQAQLPALETLVEMECQMEPQYSVVWRRALSHAKAAAVSVTPAIGETVAGIESWRKR
jgi:hypothetical protein